MYNNSITEKLQNPLRWNNLLVDNNVQQQQVGFAVMSKIQITPLKPNEKKNNTAYMQTETQNEQAPFTDPS
jgi:hypothetical protein